jgi:alanine racemase
MVRCGVAIYGLDPFGADAAARDLDPVLSLHTYVADVKRYHEGESVGYGRSWTASGDTWVAVLPVGYGDGYRRGLSNRCDVLIGGNRLPLVGTISMDNVTIDLGSETTVEPGDPVVLIGAQGSDEISAEELAVPLATINYEIPCAITSRVPRAYRS